MHNNESNIRVRFAPSPTGHLHIGGLRTALFNWLFAQHNHGKFLLRIEDTDTQRSLPMFTESILKSLEWAGLTTNEPIVIQSKNINEHKKVIERLLQEGKAYRCFCAVQSNENEYFKYDGRCRIRPYAEQDLSKPCVVRIKLPLEQKVIEFDDLIRGPIVFEMTQFDDFIIARSDGTPVYNFVVVVDDATARITHVIRGEDHISNTPKQIILYQACGYTIPHFAHLPLILGPSGARLSKRDAATAVSDYIQQGYLADALCNFLVRLGWSHGDQELFTRQELINYFTLEHVGKKSAIFDQAKLDWINSMYMRTINTADLVRYIERDVEPHFLSMLQQWSSEQMYGFINLYKERTTTLKMLVQQLYALCHYKAPVRSDEYEQLFSPAVIQHLKTINMQLANLAEWNTATLNKTIKEYASYYSLKLSYIMQPIRLALTNTTASPGIFEIMNLLGKEETYKRIEQCIALFDQQNN